MYKKKIKERVYLGEVEIEFIVECLEQRLTWDEITKEFNDKFNTDTNTSCLCNNYHRALSREDFYKNLKDTNSSKKSASRAIKISNVVMEQSTSRESFLDQFTKICSERKFGLHAKVKEVKSKKKIAKPRVVVAHLSDIHLMAMIDKEETGGINKYAEVEQSRRLAFFFKEIADYKINYRNDTELLLLINGDILQGVIHEAETVPPMVTQVACAIQLLTQGISYLAAKYKKIRVVCITGNHGRFMHKSNKGRQVKQKWDSFDTLMHIGVRSALINYKNVSFEIPSSPYAYVDVLGHKYLVLHSDTVLAIGNPGKSINVEKAKNQINDLKEGIGHIDVVAVGHVHVDTKQTLGNGVTLISNGCMSGIDEFALSIGLTKNQPSQQIWEATKDYAVGDFRSVQLLKADTMSELDSIITPFKGKF